MMTTFRRQTSLQLVLRYGLAMTAVAVGFGLRLAVTAWLGPGLPTYITFYPAVIVAVLLGGFGPGLVATVLTGLIVAYWILSPSGQFSIESPVDWVGLLIFFGMGLFISAVVELYRRDRHKAAAYDRDEALRQVNAGLRSANEELTAARRAALNLMEDAIGARRQTEQAGAALQASEQRMQQALHAGHSFTFEWQPATDEVLRSASCEKILNLTGDEACHDTGQRYFERVHSDDRARFVQILRNLTPAANTYTTEYRVVGGDRNVVELEETGQATFDAVGTLQQVVGITTDVTKRKRAEEQLFETNQRLQAIMDAVPVGVSFSDDPTCQRITGNPAVLAQFEVTPQDNLSASAPDAAASGRQIRFFLQGRQITDAELPLQRAVAENRVIPPMELEVRLPSQRRWFADASGAPIRDAQGKVIGGIAVTVDVTQRKHAEETLAAAKAAADSANHAKSQFLANMSHELRTPMNVILGMIDVALPKATDPTVQDCLQTARESADILLTLLNDVLDCAKIESGKLELESAPFSLRRALDQITSILAVRASEKGLYCQCVVPQGTPDAVLGDRVRLQQVLLNLGGNAIKFTERGGVQFSIRTLSQNGDACLEFAVQDSGIGIPPSVLDRLFQPFTQADASMTRRFGGTGLGLSICRSIVEMMGGRIWVKSELSKGSTFYFTIRLPLARELHPGIETSAALAPPASAKAAMAPLRILLAEDNPANRKVVTYLLKNRGHLVEIAEDGQEAVWLAQQNRYDAILMDIQMPKMDGLEATATIRKREAEMGLGLVSGDLAVENHAPRPKPQEPRSVSRVPIIAMTAHAMKGDRDRCLAAGMDGYLSKPVDQHEMIALLESLAVGAAVGGEIPPAIPPVSIKPASPTTALVFDLELAMERCLNATDMLQQMIESFFTDADNLLPQMRAALQKGNLVEVGRLGHRIKGTLVYLGAEPARIAALRVEHLLQHAGEQAEAEKLVHELERQCEVLKATLTVPKLSRDDR